MPAEQILQLFAAIKKKEVLKLAKEFTLTFDDLADAIGVCGKIGYEHFARFFDRNSDRLWQKIRRDHTPISIGKMLTQIEWESRRTCFHLFALKENPEFWHLFFWDSCEESGGGRFIEGSHVHFVNYLWGIGLDEITDNLPKRPKVSVHIKTKSEDAEYNAG
jgi:hypothetical protein